MEGSSEHDRDDDRPAPRRTRRHYPPALKADLIARATAPGASVSAVARAHDVNANQLFKWIARARQHGALAPGATMVPVTVSPPAPHASRPCAPAAAVAPPTSVRLALDGATLHLDGAWDPERVGALVRAIRS